MPLLLPPPTLWSGGRDPRILGSLSLPPSLSLSLHVCVCQSGCAGVRPHGQINPRLASKRGNVTLPSPPPPLHRGSAGPPAGSSVVCVQRKIRDSGRTENCCCAPATTVSDSPGNGRIGSRGADKSYVWGTQRRLSEREREKKREKKFRRETRTGRFDSATFARGVYVCV